MAQRDIECHAFMSPEIKNLAGTEGIQLISYGELARVQGEAMVTQDLAVEAAASYDQARSN